ncbi:uncharacterized protein LOC114361726 [Ostrinia furnacalis]|uniref:uncharacterized protein LOC114361726 n=1 Tax=Ostrinia furnacalis TaxID=93504 RepID=UPI00103C3D7B|nr:uncharacterized protein LOC114361726 [Ostrinia furnacalis]
MKVLLLVVFCVASVKCQCSTKESLNITSGELFSNGSVLHDGIEYVKSSWYEVVEDGVSSLMGCPCIGRVCLWKCCPNGQSLNFLRKCQDSDTLGVESFFSPPVFKGVDRVNVLAHEKFFYISNLLCDEKYMVDPSLPYEEFYIQESTN